MTRTRTYTVFTAGEGAPGAIEVLKGAAVVNDLGNIALKLVQDVHYEGDVDNLAEPPVLNLRDTHVLLEFGETTQEGEFVVFDNEAAVRQTTATGNYSGPGSQIRVY